MDSWIHPFDGLVGLQHNGRNARNENSCQEPGKKKNVGKRRITDTCASSDVLQSGAGDVATQGHGRVKERARCKHRTEKKHEPSVGGNQTSDNAGAIGFGIFRLLCGKRAHTTRTAAVRQFAGALSVRFPSCKKKGAHTGTLSSQKSVESLNGRNFISAGMPSLLPDDYCTYSQNPRRKRDT